MHLRRTLTAAVVALAAVLAFPSAPARAIVGGEPAAEGAWPWQVGLLVDGQQFCGGSIITADVVVTAAHCTDGVDASDFTVVAGTVNLNDGRAQRRHVARIAQHEDYDSTELRNDISLLFLDRPLVLGDGVEAATLPSAADEAAFTEDDDPAMVTGWGALSERGSSTNVLHQVEIDVFGDGRCEDLYAQDGDDVFGDTQVCAGTTAGHRDSCYGDSGGPLVVPNDDRSQWFLVGVVSWGAGCGIPSRPTVHTQISEYLGWMADQGAESGPAQRFTVEHRARIPAWGTRGNAALAALRLDVEGVESFRSVEVELHGLTHERVSDLDIWLVAPDGSAVTLLSDIGGDTDLANLNVVISSEGSSARAVASALGTGRVRPADETGDSQWTRGPAPADLDALVGADVEGEWRLYVTDDARGATGAIDGWTLVFR